MRWHIIFQLVQNLESCANFRQANVDLRLSLNSLKFNSIFQFLKIWWMISLSDFMLLKSMFDAAASWIQRLYLLFLNKPSYDQNTRGPRLLWKKSFDSLVPRYLYFFLLFSLGIRLIESVNQQNDFAISNNSSIIIVVILLKMMIIQCRIIWKHFIHFKLLINSLFMNESIF